MHLRYCDHLLVTTFPKATEFLTAVEIPDSVIYIYSDYSAWKYQEGLCYTRKHGCQGSQQVRIKSQGLPSIILANIQCPINSMFLNLNYQFTVDPMDLNLMDQPTIMEFMKCLTETV